MATEVLVPPLGQTVDMVTLVAWHKEVGQPVVQGEMLFAIETDKATLDIEAPASGVLQQVSAQPGDEVQVLSVIAVIAARHEAPEHQVSKPEAEPSRLGGVNVLLKQRQAAQEAIRQPVQRLFVSPRARRLAERHELPLEQISPTGPEGAIVERDVRAYLDARVGAISTGVPDHDKLAGAIPMHSMSTIIAREVGPSAPSAALVVLNAEADATELLSVRHRLAQAGIDVSPDALWLLLLARALPDHPRLNATLHQGTIALWHHVHVGLAVESGDGFVVPVIRDVERKGLLQIAAEAHLSTERARKGLCTPEDLTGRTFVLFNLGMYGIDSFTPIIDRPECAVLGVGRFTERRVLIGDKGEPRQQVWLSLTFDRNLVGSPAAAARFLQRIVKLVEQPHLLLA